MGLYKKTYIEWHAMCVQCGKQELLTIKNRRDVIEYLRKNCKWHIKGNMVLCYECTVRMIEEGLLNDI